MKGRSMNCKFLAGTVGLLAAGTLAFGTTPPVRASTPQPLDATGWSQIWLEAESGGGCAQPSAEEVNAAVISYPCESGAWWYARELNADGGWDPFPGAQYELVNSDRTLALTFNEDAQAWEMEVPNDDSTYVTDQTYPGGAPTYWVGIGSAGSDAFMLPNGKGDPLKVDTNGITVPPDGWVFCTVDPNGSDCPDADVVWVN
jgi:hypothetical protein